MQWNVKVMVELQLAFYIVLSVYGTIGIFTDDTGLHHKGEIYFFACAHGFHVGPIQSFVRCLFADLAPPRASLYSSRSPTRDHRGFSCWFFPSCCKPSDVHDSSSPTLVSCAPGRWLSSISGWTTRRANARSGVRMTRAMMFVSEPRACSLTRSLSGNNDASVIGRQQQLHS